MVKFSHVFGDISSATLGYITGGRNGAKLFNGLYQKHKNGPMVAIPRSTKRKRSKFNAGSKFTKKPKGSHPFKKPGMSRNPDYRPRARKEFSHARNATTAAKSVKRKKAVEYKKPRSVKVSKPLRAKINKVISGRTYPGYYQSTFYGEVSCNVNDAQAVFQLNFDGLPSDYAFSPNQILNAASILWNGKTPFSYGGPSISDTTNFDAHTFKIHIRKSWTVTQFRNNSQRVIYLKMFECKPVNMQNQALPVGLWTTALADMATGFPFSENPQSTVLTTLHADPNSLVQWRRYFSAEVTKFVIEPGQTIDYTVQGPSNVDVDFAKFWQGNAYQQITKMNRHQFGVMYYNLESSTATGAVAGRYPETGLNGIGLLWEANAHYCLDIPEKAGWVSGGTVPVTGGVPLGERHNAYCVFNPGYATTTPIPASVVDVNDENPALVTVI